jgi:hypothetical protein
MKLCVQFARSGLYIDDVLCSFGVYRGRGLYSIEWYSHATVWLVAIGLTKGQDVVFPALCMML